METLVFLLMVLVVAACLAVWRRIFARWHQGISPVPYEPRRPVPWTVAHLLFIVLLYVYVQWMAQWLAQHTLGLESIQAVDPDAMPDVEGPIALEDLGALLVANSLANVLVIAITIGLLMTTVRATWRDLGFTWRGSDVLLGLAAFVATCVPVYAMQAALRQFFTDKHPLVIALEQSPTPSMLLISSVAAVVVAPLVEEFLFRGVIQGWLEAVWPRRVAAVAPADGTASADAAGEGTVGLPTTVAEPEPSLPASDGVTNPYASPELADRAEVLVAETSPNLANRPAGWGPICVSSLLFAAVHYGNGPDPIPLFFLALGLGYLYQRTHRLWPSVVVHVCLNASSLLLLWIEMRQ